MPEEAKATSSGASIPGRPLRTDPSPLSRRPLREGLQALQPLHSQRGVFLLSSPAWGSDAQVQTMLTHEVVFEPKRSAVMQICQGTKGAYELQEKLGAGGNGEVWRAKGPNGQVAFGGEAGTSQSPGATLRWPVVSVLGLWRGTLSAVAAT